MFVVFAASEMANKHTPVGITLLIGWTDPPTEEIGQVGSFSIDKRLINNVCLGSTW